jgi:hypothetical protein
MSNKDLIKIKFENNEYEISIPSDIEDLKKKFFEKFDANEDCQYDFFIKLSDQPDPINLNNLYKVNFVGNMDLLKKEENPIINVEQHVEFGSSNFFDDNKSSFLSKVQLEIQKENSKKSNNSNNNNNNDIDEEEEDEKNNYKENKDFIKELINCENNINSLINGEEIYTTKKTIELNEQLSFANKYSDEMSQISVMQMEKIIELEQNFELLKQSIKDNKDKIELKFKEMEKVYEKDKYIQEIKKKHEEELMDEKNKYKKLELKFEEEKKINKKELEERIDKLKKENDMLKEKIEKYESDNQKIMEILKKQNK